MDRREFLRLAGAAAATFSLDAPALAWLSAGDRRRFEVDRRAVATVCGACPGGCGLSVRLVGGHPVSLTGNPLSPLNRTGLCPLGAASLQAFYHPERLRAPLVREGARGEGRWRAVGWEEALGQMAAALAKARDERSAGDVVIWSGPRAGLEAEAIRRFGLALGTEHVVFDTDPWSASWAAALGLCQGVETSPAYDLERASYVLTIGTTLLDPGPSPLRFQRAHARLRSRRPRPVIVHAGSRGSVGALKADRWLPLEPGTEGLFALGIARVIVNEGLYDKGFVRDRTEGFESSPEGVVPRRMGFREYVQRHVSLDEVSRVTGVPVAAISRVAKDFAHKRPSVALGGADTSNATLSLWAIQCLNALVGGIEAPGGMLVPRPIPLDPLLPRPVEEGPAGEETSLRPAGADRDAEIPARPAAVLVLEANPLFERPQCEGLRRRFQEATFLACVSSFLDETASHADVVLPAPSYLEIWRDSPAPQLGKAAILGLTQPVVPRRTEGRSAGDLVLELARALGGVAAKALPWRDFEAMIKDGFRGVYDARRGALFDSPSEEAWVESLAARGWWYPSYTTFDDFWRQVTASGGWWDPVHVFGEWDRVLRTPSGRFEFRSARLEAAVRERARSEGRTEAEVLRSIGIEAPAETAYLPRYDPVRLEGDPGQFPLILRPFPLLTLREGTPANLPFLQEIPAPEVQRRWDSWVEVSEGTAHRLGLHDGDAVRVESPRGSLRTRVAVLPGGPDDVAGIPIGQGHTASSSVARGRGVNPLALVPEVRDPLSGALVRTATRVRLVKE